MPRLLEVATCVAERYPSLRIFCETNARVTRLPFPFSQRSHVGNLRQTIQGKGEKIRGWKPQVSTLLCARAASAHSPLRFSEKLPARQGRTRLRQFASPRSAGAEKTACAVRIPRLPYTAKTKKAPLTRCLSLLWICRPLSSSSCRNYRSRRRYYHHRYRRNRSRRCPDRSIPRSR